MHFQMANRIFYACFTTEHSFQKLKSIEYQALYKVPNFLASFHTAFFLCSVLVCLHVCVHVPTCGSTWCVWMQVEVRVMYVSSPVPLHRLC